MFRKRNALTVTRAARWALIFFHTLLFSFSCLAVFATVSTKSEVIIYEIHNRG
nr:MAG TPA: hypothetical protein [Caudoviricetes sp.]